MKDEYQIVIDALPYIDNNVIDDESVESLIEKEMNDINKKIIDDEINNKFKLNVEEINKDKIDTINFFDFVKFDIPKEKNKESEWNKIFKNLNCEIENLQNDSLNLELMNTIGVKYWESFIKNFRNVINTMEQEKNTLNSEILYLNKKRKFNQLNYKDELDKLQLEINTQKQLLKESKTKKNEKK